MTWEPQSPARKPTSTSAFIGVPVDAVQLDATVPSEHRIDYVATDPKGLTGSATRTVIVCKRPPETAVFLA